MESIVKIAAVGLIVAVLNMILHKVGREDYAMLMTLAGIVAIIVMLLPELSGLLETVKTMFPT